MDTGKEKPQWIGEKGHKAVGPQNLLASHVATMPGRVGCMRPNQPPISARSVGVLQTGGRGVLKP